MQNQVSAQSGSLTVGLEGRVATVTIGSLGRKNAMTLAMWRDMAKNLEALGKDGSARAIVITGAGGDFCAGADIGEFEALRGNAASARDYEAANSAAFAAIRLCSVPTIASIRGVCFGGGFGIAAACDLRIAATSALFSVPAARLGLAYPVDAMADIVAAVGPQMAKYLTFSAARLDAGAALDAGFILEIAEPGTLDRRVAELAATIAENAPLSVRASKASIRAALSGRQDDAGRAAALGDATFESEDYAEGRAAFLAKRRASFQGR